MNPDQKVIAWLGLGLILLVIWGAYKPTLKAILFTAPASSSAGSTAGSILPLLPAVVPLLSSQTLPTASTGAPAQNGQILV